MTRAGNHGAWIIAVTAIFLLLSLGQAAQCQETPNTSVTGKVLMPDGAPANGATVELRSLWWDRRPIAVTKTDESGNFKASPPVGKYQLHAMLGALVGEDRQTAVSVAEGTPAGPYQLTLARGTVVSGIVTEKATGKPMEGVRVITNSGDSAETSASGGYSLILPRRNHTISALKDGFHRPIIQILANRETMDLAIELKPGGTIKGTVTDTEGKPVAGVSVGLPNRNMYFQATKTNAKGEYSLPGIDLDARTEISAHADGYEWGNDASAVFAAGEREATLDLKLTPSKTRIISGRVTGKAGKPVKGASVTYGMGSSYWDNKTATTDADGKYEMQVSGQDENIVMAQAKGCAPAFGVVPADADAVVNLVMAPGHWAEGGFEDEDGEPLGRVHISVCAQTDTYAKAGITYENRYRWIQRVDTDEKGHFRVEDLPADGVSIETFAYKEGYARIDGMPLKVDAGDQIIVLNPTGKVSGRVLSAEDGSPITKFTVVGEGNLRTTTIESPDGTFTLSSSFIVPGGKVTVGVEAPGYQRETKYVEAKAKADFNSAVFRLKRTHDFVGTVTDGEGRPLEGVLVTARPVSSSYTYVWNESEKPSARTDENGRFRIASVPMDAAAITVEKPGYGTLVFPNAILTKPLTAGMQKAAVITGIVADSAGKPLPGIRTEVYRKSAQVAQAKSDEKGVVRFEDLPPGKYRVNANDYAHGRITCHTAEVKSGEVYEIDWDKPGEAELEGKVTRNGRPVAEASVDLFEGDETMWCAVSRTDATGAYSITVPKATGYRVHYYAKKYEEGHGSLEMTMKPGKNHLDIELPGASISGKVFDQSSGKPIANANVTCLALVTSEQIWGRQWISQDVKPWFNAVGRAKTDGKGQFTFANLGPGKCLVALESEQNRVPGSAIKLGKDEQKTGVIVRIPPTGQAHVKVVDDATGKSLEDVLEVFCVNKQGVRFSPAYEQSGSGLRPTYALARTPEGKLIVPSLPAGRYSLYALSDSRLPLPAAFDIKANETTNAAIRMKKSERIVFRLTGDHPPREVLKLGYTITPPDGKAVLTGVWGPCLGSTTFFNEELEACIPLKPGTYLVRAVLLNENSSWDISSGDNLWSTKQTVKIAPGKDTVIEVRAIAQEAK